MPHEPDTIAMTEGRRWALGVTAMLSSVLLHAGTVRAQSLDLQVYRPAASLDGLSTVREAAASAPYSLTVTATAVYAKDPLVLRDGSHQTASVVSDRVDLVVTSLVGLGHGLDLALVAPLVPYQHTGAAWEGAGFAAVDQHGAALSDLRLELNWSVLEQQRHGVDLALSSSLSFGVAAGSSFAGSGSARATPGFAVTRRWGRLFAAANFGYGVGAAEQLGTTRVGSPLLWATGVGVEAAAPWTQPRALVLGLEIFGRTNAAAPFLDSRQSPAEVLASVRVRLGGVVLTAGAGTGLTRGYGAPQWRGVIGVGWVGQRDPTPVGPTGHEPSLTSEPLAQAPPPTVPAPADAEASLAEPEPNAVDSDGDGRPDDIDSCAAEPEDEDGFEDDDGCPDHDNDGDAIPDETDACPNSSEDPDGFEDADGCPDDDNDDDGIADIQDACPDEAEIVNGVVDSDGCPDAGEPLVQLRTDTVTVNKVVFFGIGSVQIKRRARRALDQVAALMRNHQDIVKIRVEGHTDAVGPRRVNLRLSRRRARVVRDYLRRRGVQAHRVEAIGRGEEAPRVSETLPRGRARNRRVQFYIVRQAAARTTATTAKPAGRKPSLTGEML